MTRAELSIRRATQADVDVTSDLIDVASPRLRLDNTGLWARLWPNKAVLNDYQGNPPPWMRNGAKAIEGLAPPAQGRLPEICVSKHKLPSGAFSSRPIPKWRWDTLFMAQALAPHAGGRP